MTNSLHGGPGAQTPTNSFTGQYASTAGFYDDYNYGRAVDFMTWITQQVHSNNEFQNVGMLELINEPLSWDNAVESMRSEYYVNAYNVSRASKVY